MTIDPNEISAADRRMRAEGLLRAADNPNTTSDPAIIGIGHALLAIEAQLSQIAANTDTFNAQRDQMIASATDRPPNNAMTTKGDTP